MADPCSNNQLQWLLGLGFVLILNFPFSDCNSIHEILRSNGLPVGLLPKAVKSFTLEENGQLQVILDRPCYAKFANRVYFESVIRANLSYGELKSVAGLSQEELFLWLPVKDIKVDDPRSGIILFDIGVVHKQLALSLFEDPPDCEPEGDEVLNLRSGFLQKDAKQGTGFEDQRQ